VSSHEEQNPDGPARGPSFSVVAPAIGVCVFLAALAASRCDMNREAVISAPSTPSIAAPGKESPESAGGDAR
jgi:hypothetical protein